MWIWKDILTERLTENISTVLLAPKFHVYIMHFPIFKGEG